MSKHNGKPTTKTMADSDVPQHDDGLSVWVQRINAAVKYAGEDDHEDVRSILKEFRHQVQGTDMVATNPDANTDLLKSALSNPKSKAEEEI